jgi:uncharacterized protein (DUF885 family)
MLKRKFNRGKFTKNMFLLVLLLASSWVVNLIWFKPFSVDLFYERMFFEYGLARPEMMTKHHIYEKYSFNDYARTLNSISTDKLSGDMDALIKNWDMLKSYKYSKQTPDQKISTKTLDFYWEMSVYMQQYEQIMFYSYPINHLNGVHISLIDFMLNTHEIKNLADAENYLQRLRHAPEKITQTMSKFEYHSIPPTYIIDKVIVQIEDFINTDIEDNLIIKDFHRKVNSVQNLSPQARNEFFYEVKKIVEDEVLPSYEYLLQELRRARERSVASAGVWQLEMGDIYYEDLLRYHLSRHFTEMVSPDDLAYELMQEMAERKVSLRTIFDSLGYEPTDSTEFIMENLAYKPEFHYNDSTTEGRISFLEDLRVEIQKNNKEMSRLFDVSVVNSLEIREMVTHRTPYSSRFFYYPSSLDEYRTAKLFVNTDTIGHIAKFMIPAIVHFNVTPGEHFVKTVQHHLTELPTFRRAVEFDAYIDGWAFYAQRFLKENGYYENLHDELGRQYYELLMSTLAMTDFYVHEQRYERADAVEFIVKNTGLPNFEAEAFVDRVTIEPGRAFSYWEGYKSIVELKEYAKTELGNRFNLKSFHQTILGCGPVPLSILKMVVEQHVAEVKPAERAE